LIGAGERGADTQEAVDTILGALYSRAGLPYDAHLLRHALSDAGVPAPSLRDIPRRAEPSPVEVRL
jgi:hypothetical protein